MKWGKRSNVGGVHRVGSVSNVGRVDGVYRVYRVGYDRLWYWIEWEERDTWDRRSNVSRVDRMSRVWLARLL